MKKAEQILKSKQGILDSQRLNVTWQLLKTYEELKTQNGNNSLMELIPVRIVASNESFFKETFAEIINHDKAVLNRASSLLKKNNIKITLEDVSHITSKKFTIGDLIAYSLSYSSIDNILKNFEELTGINVYKEIDKMEEFLKSMELDENIINENRPFDKNRILRNLNSIYEIRHEICHDFLSTSYKLDLKNEMLRDVIMDTGLLQHCIIELCSIHVYKDIELDEEKRMANLELKISEELEKINILNDKIKSTFHSNEQIENFKKGINAFQDFIDLDSRNFGFWFNEDGPFDDLILEHKLKLIINRKELLEDQLK